MATDSETKLSLKLKSLCEQYGNKWKEKNPKESAKILRRLGIFYKNKCSNHLSNTLEKKITFIQSAALLNCAFKREHNKSTKIHIKNDLQNLCFEVLLSAKARRHKFDLINFANELKKDIDKWRENVKKKVETSFPISKQINKETLQQLKFEQQKIKTVEDLQEEITEKYKEFMRKVSQMTIKVLGDLPCNFALVGMGSMARKEITPYSDFENIIVMQEGVQNDKESYETMLEYFRWYAAIFQVILINLRETVLPSVAIPSLNDYTCEDKNWFYDAYTKRGISYDGIMPHLCKSPLGRQPTEKKPWEIELIKPVSLLATYLRQEQNLKNGYHLRDILTNICFVDGSHDVYQIFENTIEGLLTEEQSNSMQEFINMVTDDMQKYSTKLSIFSIIDKNSYNTKQFAYRSIAAFIAGIAKLKNIKPGSCFDVVRRMQNVELVSEEFSCKLQYAVALACEIRLKAYFEHGYQYDYVELSLEHSDEDVSINLKNAVGVQCSYDYLEITCCLQYDIIAWLGINCSYMLYHPVAMCIAISSFLQMPDCIIAAKGFIKDHLVLQDQPEINDILAVEDPDDCYKDCGVTVKQSVKSVDISKSSVQSLGEWYLKMQTFNQALIKYFPSQISSPNLKHLNVNTNNKNNISIFTEFGEYFFIKGVYFEALFCYKIALKVIQKETNATEPCQQVKCLFSIGKCLSEKEDYHNAKKIFLEALGQYRLLSDKHQNLQNFEGDSFKEIGMCQQCLGLKKEAFESFEAAVESYADKQNDSQLDSVGFCQLKMGIHLFNTNRYEDALFKFKELLMFYSRCDNFNLLSAAKCHFYIGRCLQNLNQYEEASKHLHEAISLHREDMDDQERSKIYKAFSFTHVGNCFVVENDHTQAIENFLKSLELWKNLVKDYPNDKEHLLNLAIAHQQIGNCFAKFRFEKEAIEHFELAVAIYQTLERPCDCLSVYKSLGKAYKNVENMQKACSCYQACLSLLKDETTSIKAKADLNRLFGSCMRKMDKKKAHKLINLALNAYLKLYETEVDDRLSLLRCIGLCYWHLGKSNEARNYLGQYVALSENSKSLLSVLDQFLVFVALYIIGVSWSQENNRKLALHFFNKSLQKVLALPKSLEYEHEIACLYNKIGEHWLNERCENKAKSNFQKAEKFHDSLLLTSKGKQALCYIYKNFGRVFSQQDSPDYSKAISYFKKAEKMFSDLNNEKYKREIAWLMKSTGKCCIEQKQFVEAIKYFKKSEKVYKSLYETGFVLTEIAFIMKNLGICYQQLLERD